MNLEEQIKRYNDFKRRKNKGKDEIVFKELFLRYYMGRHRIQLIERMGKKALIRHLEHGYVGNKREGYKEVFLGYTDICLIRHCYKKQINYPNFGLRMKKVLEGLR